MSIDFAFDLHIHTSFGSLDSGITRPFLREAASRVRLGGLAITEHTHGWSDERLDEFRAECDFLIIGAREFSTEWGHIVTLVQDPEILMLTSVPTVPELRDAVLAAGGFMIMAHPFRYFPGRSNFLFGDDPESASYPPEELALHPVFQYVDEVEVLNSGCTVKENQTAQAVAMALGMSGVAGSDAHSPLEVGRCVNIFPHPIETQEELIWELRAGAHRIAQRNREGDLIPLAEAIGL